MDERIPTVYNSLDLDLLEQQNYENTPKTSILKKRPTNLCCAFHFFFRFCPPDLPLYFFFLSLHPPSSLPLLPFHFFFFFFLSRRSTRGGKIEKERKKFCFLAVTSAEKSQQQQKKGKNICSPKTEEKTPLSFCKADQQENTKLKTIRNENRLTKGIERSERERRLFFLLLPLLLLLSPKN